MDLGSEAAPFDFYVRQLKDMKGSIDLERLDADDLAIYGRICGAVLARAHTRAGGATQITGYLGDTDAFDLRWPYGPTPTPTRPSATTQPSWPRSAHPRDRGLPRHSSRDDPT